MCWRAVKIQTNKQIDFLKIIMKYTTLSGLYFCWVYLKCFRFNLTTYFCCYFLYNWYGVSMHALIWNLKYIHWFKIVVTSIIQVCNNLLVRLFIWNETSALQCIFRIIMVNTLYIKEKNIITRCSHHTHVYLMLIWY
jgi:hypothetical protein